jgi:hypothetical protein
MTNAVEVARRLVLTCWTPRVGYCGESATQNHHEAKDLPGYNPSSPEVAKSRITSDEFKELQASLGNRPQKLSYQ